jgi:hypothetical protein
MSLFKKSKEKIEAEKLYNLLSDKTNNFTLNDIKNTILKQGYSEKVSSLVVKMITDNKLPLKKESAVSEKEAVLRELSESLKKKDLSKQESNQEKQDDNKSKINNLEKQDVNKSKVNNLEKQEVLTKPQNISNNKEKVKNLKDVNKVSFLKKTGLFFKKIYFFLEDNYYKGIDYVSKVVPVNKLTDKIDKYFPSFILFLLILALLLYLIFSGAFSFTKEWTISVEVNDPSNTPLNNALVTLQIKDENILSNKTDVFGEVIFRDFKSKKQDLTLIVSKEHFKTTTKTFKLSKTNLRQIITLSIDTDNPEVPVNPAQEREITFVENNNLLITNETLNLTFSCTNNERTPDPRQTLISNGRVVVKTPASCGSLRVSVTSNNFSPITNQVIGEDNKVTLTRINLDRGTLGVSVKNLSKMPLSGAEAKIYNHSQSTSLLALDIKTTDIYGLLEFSLEPKQYLLTVSKEGYLTQPKKGPLTVVKDNVTNTDVILFTREELINFDCQDPKYSDFCIDDDIDCANEHLKPFLRINEDGTCTIGNPGYISVTLKDSNTSEPVFADITLESKLKDSDQNYSFTEYIAIDTNHFVFDVVDFYNYRVRVLNTEEKGYLLPDPIEVTSLDSNITVLLEFSSELNSGKIGVNVKNQGLNISNARVYLYREFEDGFMLVNAEPKLTDQYGDVNFPFQRANKEYYAYSIHNILDKQGVSEIKHLDVNSFLELDVNLEDIPKTLNLKINPNIEYDINFYDSSHYQITEYVQTTIDQNTQYYFTGPIDSIYALVSSTGYTTYQTELITLIPDQEVFKEITLTSLQACENTKIEILGLYDETGTIKVENIDFVQNTLDDEYRLKFKYTSCLEDADFKQVHIRTGNQIFIDDDYLSLVSEQINVYDVDVFRGYRFFKEHIPDFNSSLFNENYSLDRSYNYLEDDYKWLEINFLELPVDVLEFSVNFKFREKPIAPIENYLVGYRSIATKFNETYSYNPILPASWNQIPFYTDSYFYAETNKYFIPFLSTDYIYQTKIKDWNGDVLEPNAHGYVLSIDDFYKFDLSYLFLKDGMRTGNILQSSQYTNNNLEYVSYGYLSSLGDSEPEDPGSLNIYYHIPVNDTSYLLDSFNVSRGYSLNKFTLLKPKGFFEKTSFSDSKMVSNILDNFPKIEIPVFSYYSDADFVFEITTSDPENELFVGQNNVSFKVIDNYGEPVSNVFIKYIVPGGELISLGSTNAQGLLQNKNISFSVSDISKMVDFRFIFTPEFGFSQNTVTRKEKVLSGYSILEDKINSAINYYNINDSFIIDSKQLGKYNIFNKSSISSILNDLSFNSDSGFFDTSQTKQNIISSNSVPKNITLEQTEITTDLVLLDTTTFSGSLNSIYRNFLKLSDSVTIILDVDANITLNNLGNIKTSIDFEPNKGIDFNSTSNVYTLELIKEVNPQIIIDYNISTSKDIILKNISLGQVPEFIDRDVLENSINISDLVITSQGYVLEIDFQAKDSFVGQMPQTGTIKITLNLLIDGIEVFLTQDFIVKLFSKDSLVDISYENDSITIHCLQDGCQQNKSYSFKKNIDTYNISLLQNVEIVPIDSDLATTGVNITDSLPLDSEEKNRNVAFNSDYSSLSSFETQGIAETLFNFSVAGFNDFNIGKDINYTIYKIDQLELDSNVGFDYCIGVGGQEVNNDIFILGFCEDVDQSCVTGEAVLPKVFFNWGEAPLEGSWTNKCISDNQNDASEKYACDSLQMLISIFYKIQNGVDDKFYIKLLNDGISNDLLKDFINYNPGPYLDFKEPDNSDLFTHQAVDDGLFKITINNNPNLKVFSPGIYKVDVFGKGDDYYNNSHSDEKIDVRLERVSDIRASELSVFHYMPFNGSLKKDGQRKGYGIRVINDPLSEDDTIKLTPSLGIDYKNVQDPITQLLTINYNNLSGLKNTLESGGYLLDVEKLPGDNLKMKYTPSYPIPLYAHAACLEDNNLSYNLYKNNDYLLLPELGINNNFLKWNYNDSILSDLLYSGQDKFYYRLNTNNILDNNINMHTMLYLPTHNYFTINDIYLRTSEFLNNENTKIFSKGNLEGAKDIGFSNSDFGISGNLEDLRTIKGIFEFVKTGQACISKSPVRTYIKWVDDKVEFTPNELSTIENNIPSNYTCPQ